MARILIIDDDEGVRETLGVYSEMLGYEPVLVADPSLCDVFHLDGHECSKDAPCADILLINQFLPTMSGLDFVERQINNGCIAPAHCKAILAEVLTDQEFKQAKKLGCHVLQKPVTYEILENWLNGVEGENDKRLQEVDGCNNDYGVIIS